MPINTYPDSGSSSSSGSSAPKSSGSGSAGGGGGVDPYTKAIRAQKKAEAKAKHKAADRMIRDAKVLGAQAASLQAALSSTGFAQALATGLANIARTSQQSDDVLMEGYGQRLGSLGNAASDNEKAEAGQSYANLTNRGREAANALSEAMAQGAGESDVLRAQQMSLRNWNQNQAEVNRSFFDTLTSVNSSLHDLNADTKTARINNQLQAEADRGQLYANYYDQVGQTQTQLGNVLGQQASDYSAALEQVGSKKTRRKQKRAQAASSAAFMDAAHTAGQAYSSPGASPALMAWSGAGDFEGHINNGSEGLNSGSTTTNLGRPEGASLRKWDQ